MSFLSGFITIGILDTIFGVFIWLREDFRLFPKALYKNLATEDRSEFTTNFGKGLTLTGICILTACVDLFNNDIIRWSLFGFTLAYSDLFLRRARKLAMNVNVNVSTKTKSEKIDDIVLLKIIKNKKKNIAIISSFVLGTILLGGYILVSFYTLINNKPFENFISTENVVSASIHFVPTNQTIELNNYQLNEFIEIFNNMIIYEEITTNFFDSDMITYNITRDDGTVYEIKAMGNLLMININDVLYRYTIDEKISEELIFHAMSVV